MRLTLALLVTLFSAHAGQPPVTKSEFREAVEGVEELSRTLQTQLKTYHSDLLASLHQQGYAAYYPLFRTQLDGLVHYSADLEYRDEFMMGRFAFELKRGGNALSPDPFLDWAEIQTCLDHFHATIDKARSVVERTGVVDANKYGDIPLDEFRKLNTRWRAALRSAFQSYDHAVAVRPVEVRNGTLVPAQENESNRL